MRNLFFTTLFLIFTCVLFAQTPLPKGSKQFNAGVGFSDWGIPLYLGMDFGVHRDISLGAEVSFRTYQEKYNKNIYTHNIIGISGNGNYHFNSLLDIPSQWDFYAGLNLGFYIWKSNTNYAGRGDSGLGVGAQIGGRYYFNSKVGINLELGGGNAVSGGKFGISIKI